MEEGNNILYEKLAQLQWLLKRCHMRGHAGRGPWADPTRGQGRVIAMLKLQPEISTRDLSYLLGIRHQSLNELLGKLEKAGYITRQPSEADRRVTLVRLTEKGQAEQQERRDTADLFSCLTPEEQAILGGYIDRMIAQLESQLEGSDELEDMAGWVQAARARMGGDKLDRLMAMGGDFHRRGRGRRGPEGGPRGGFGPGCHDGDHGHHGRDGDDDHGCRSHGHDCGRDDNHGPGGHHSDGHNCGEHGHDDGTAGRPGRRTYTPPPETGEA